MRNCAGCIHFKLSHPMVAYRGGFKGLCTNEASDMNIIANTDDCKLFEKFMKRWVA